MNEELEGIQHWALLNNLKPNPNKFKEMLFKRRTRIVNLPPPLPGIECVDSMIVLGVGISYDLRASAHVDRLLGRCISSLHALCILHAHGLPQDALHNVAKATLLSRRCPDNSAQDNSARTIRRGQFGVKNTVKLCFGQFGATICCGQFVAKYNIDFIENPACIHQYFS